MRHRFHALMILATGITILAPATHADSVAAARRAIQAIYDGQNAAAARRDVNGMLAHVSPDYVSFDTHGTRHTLDGERQAARTVFATAPTYKGQTHIQTITLAGKVATVQIKEHKAMIVIHRPTRQFAIVAYDTVGVDTWVRGRQGWLLTRSQTLSAHGTFNGHPVKD